MNLLRYDKMLFIEPVQFNNKDPGGMVNLSNKLNFSLVIGHCFLVQSLKVSIKFQTHWLGPYEIETIFDNGAVIIKIINEEKVTFIANGHRL